MNWARKEKDRHREHCFSKSKKPKKDFNIKKYSDPEKVFIPIPLILDWHEHDCCPVLVIISPHKKFNKIAHAYYNGICQSHGYAWRSDDFKSLYTLQDKTLSMMIDRKNIPTLFVIAFDPDRHSMSMLLKSLPLFHKIASERFAYELELEKVHRRNYDWVFAPSHGVRRSATTTITLSAGAYIGTTGNWYIQDDQSTGWTRIS